MIGSPVRITIRPPNRKSVTLSGQLTFVDPEVSRIKKDVLIKAEFDNTKLTILPGMAAEIEITGQSKTAKLAAPANK